MKEGETLTVVPEFCNSEFAYHGWHLYANGKWVRGMLEHSLMVACGFDPAYGSTPAHTSAWWRFVGWYVETYPQGTSFKVLPFGALELITKEATDSLTQEQREHYEGKVSR